MHYNQQDSYNLSIANAEIRNYFPHAKTTFYDTSEMLGSFFIDYLEL